MYITARSFPIRTRLTARLFSLAVATSALGALNVDTTAYAQEYFNRSVKMVVPYPPGGGTDIAARWVAGKLSDVLKQTMFVDNLPGANGNLGTDYIAKAAPDGYVIGMATPGPVTVGRSLYPDLPYDPQRDLEPIILANESPIVLAVNPAISAKSLKELVALAKSKPGKLSAALVSTGSVPHLLTEMLKMSSGINILDVPYKGGAPATLDVISGQVDMLFSVLPLILPNIKAGQLRPLAIASKTRSPLLPDVPTTAEEGYGDVVGSAWNGIVAPAGTPKGIIDKLNADTSQILMTPDTKQRFNQLGMESVGGTPEDFAKFLQAESQKWGKVIAKAHLQAP